mmetsp:Transcript_3869/g.8235  ORF Transcript_3869/g.8235 Transcript_3869/m.8235 type:complete len:322 (-) Transcript_3869:176-1141(-)
MKSALHGSFFWRRVLPFTVKRHVQSGYLIEKKGPQRKALVSFDRNSSSVPSSPTSSVSSDEVAKFSNMAPTWWDSDLNPLIGMNPVRVSFIVDALTSHRKQTEQHAEHAAEGYFPLKGMKALDVGCGGGLLSESLARLGADVTAIDPSDEVVTNAANEHSSYDRKTSTINYCAGMSVEALASEHGVRNERIYDIVCMLEVLEHATDQHGILQAAAGLLKKPTPGGQPGGTLFVSTINRTAKSYAFAIVGGEHITRMLPVGTHKWENFRSPKEVEQMVGNYGLSGVGVSGMVIKPPYYDMRWKLDPNDTDINWIGAYMRKEK